MEARRFTRETNAHSKKLRNHIAAVGLHFAHYNLCRIHTSLRMTPAMALGVTDHIWTLAELMDAALAAPPPEERAVVGMLSSEPPSQLPLAGMPMLRIIPGGR